MRATSFTYESISTNLLPQQICPIPVAIIFRVLATPAHGGPRDTNALMYRSFQACGWFWRKYSVYIFPILCAMRTTGPPALLAISSIICFRRKKYSLFSSTDTDQVKTWEVRHKDKNQHVPENLVFCAQTDHEDTDLGLYANHRGHLEHHRFWYNPFQPLLVL